MDTHVRNLGRFNILFGIAGILMLLTMLIIYGGFGELLTVAQMDWFVAALGFSVLFHALLAVPAILAGYAVINFRDWSRPVLIVVSALNLLNVPFGSALGVYGLWVLMSAETEPLFFDPPPDIKAAQRSRTTAKKPSETQASEMKPASILRSRRADAGPQ